MMENEKANMERYLNTNRKNPRYPPIEESLAHTTMTKPRTKTERRQQIAALEEEYDQIGDLNPGWDIDSLNGFPPVQINSPTNRKTNMA